MLTRFLLMLVATASLAACDPAGRIAPGGAAPAPTAGSSPQLPAQAEVAAAIADATLPPPSAISPTARTTIDDTAILVAFEVLDAATDAADVLLAVRPAIAGTHPARALANALEETSTWLMVASQAQRAGQAHNYRTALGHANHAIGEARLALADVRRESVNVR